ncbi:hypothetical protein [Vibrio sinaloensis]|uniref:hypothetical protein n=1 Tax=Photobacterium sp. (strain ATCC 43367) TaxID=379097 RepID=UPI002F3E915D
MPSKEIRADRGGFAYDGSGFGNSPTFNVNNVARYSSLLNPLLEKLVESYDPDAECVEDAPLPHPDEKLSFNDVQVFSAEIIECVSFMALVEGHINTIDDESPGSKAKLLRAIYKSYQNQRRDLLIDCKINISDKESVLNTVRSNSDLLIRNVVNSIIDNAEADLYMFPKEDIQDSAMLVVCFGFINCKILEKPDDYK